MTRNRTIQLAPGTPKIVFGRRLTKAEKKVVKRQVTRTKLARQEAKK